MSGGRGREGERPRASSGSKGQPPGCAGGIHLRHTVHVPFIERARQVLNVAPELIDREVTLARQRDHDRVGSNLPMCELVVGRQWLERRPVRRKAGLRLRSTA